MALAAFIAFGHPWRVFSASLDDIGVDPTACPRCAASTSEQALNCPHNFIDIQVSVVLWHHVVQ
jgi:hypothetical protein